VEKNATVAAASEAMAMGLIKLDSCTVIPFFTGKVVHTIAPCLVADAGLQQGRGGGARLLVDIVIE
jgi:hypothetical protein